MSEFTAKTLLNRYQVRAFVGRGGMGDVYKVWDSQRSTYLAMKVLHEHLAVDRVFMRRFKNEAAILEKLRHPNIIPFYKLEQDGALVFMLLEFIDGDTLKEKLFDADAPLSKEQVLYVAKSLCSALQFAHNEGLVHCDIKPENIIIRENGEVLLADFGIARHTDAATATLAGAGTPYYMPPEQMRGGEPSLRMDIYALGATLYELLSGGEHPLSGDKAEIEASMMEKILWESLNVEPQPLTEFNHELAQEVNDVVMKCLAKNPSERYASANDVFQALLVAYQMDAEDVVSPVWKPSLKNRWMKYRPRPDAQKKSWFLWLVLAVVLLLAIAAYYGRAIIFPAPPATSTVAAMKAPSATPIPLEIIAKLTEHAKPTHTPQPTDTPLPSPTRVKYTTTPEPQVIVTKAEEAWKECADGVMVRSVGGDMELYVDEKLNKKVFHGKMYCINISPGKHFFLWRQAGVNKEIACTKPRSFEVVVGDRYDSGSVREDKVRNPYEAWVDGVKCPAYVR